MNDDRRVIYVASPLRGNFTLHTEMAKALGRVLQVASAGRLIAFVPHLHFTQFLNDGDEIERGVGMDAARYMLRVCDELWIFDGLGISGGMRDEEIEANRIGLPVKHFPTLTDWTRAAETLATPVIAVVHDGDDGRDDHLSRLGRRWKRAAQAAAAASVEAEKVARDLREYLDGIASVIDPEAMNDPAKIVNGVLHVVAECRRLREGKEKDEAESRTYYERMKKAETELENVRVELTTSWEEKGAIKAKLDEAEASEKRLYDAAVRHEKERDEAREKNIAYATEVGNRERELALVLMLARVAVNSQGRTHPTTHEALVNLGKKIAPLEDAEAERAEKEKEGE